MKNRSKRFVERRAFTDTHMFLDRENWLGSFYELAMERRPPCSRARHDHVSDWSQIDQRGNGCARNPASAIASPGQVVRGYQVFFVSHLG